MRSRVDVARGEAYSKQRFPVAERLCHEEMLGIYQAYFHGTKRDVADVARAIRKIQDNIDELR